MYRNNFTVLPISVFFIEKTTRGEEVFAKQIGNFVVKFEDEIKLIEKSVSPVLVLLLTLQNS